MLDVLETDNLFFRENCQIHTKISLDQLKKIEHHLKILDLYLEVVTRCEFVVFLSWGGGEHTYINCMCRKKDVCGN